MLNITTPEKLLNYYVDELNKGNVSSLLALYENNACFVPQPGQVVKGLESIRQNLQTFIDMKGTLKTNIKKVINAADIALVTSEWSFNGIGHDGKTVNLAGKATDVLRQQSDGTWRILIDNPWGID